jgi:hypothetical protein
MPAVTMLGQDLWYAEVHHGTKSVVRGVGVALSVAKDITELGPVVKRNSETATS